VDNINMDLREIRWGGMNWIDLAQDRGPVESYREDGNEALGSIKCWETLECYKTDGFSRRAPWS
jgi:hypothetical protein